MTMTFDGQENGVADTMEDAPEQATLGRRRFLLGGIGGGLALTAGGLMLPDRFLAEVAAREGANDGALGGRHGKDRHGRRHRRQRHHQRHRRQNDHGRGDGFNPIKGIEFRVTVSGARSVSVESYRHRWDDFTEWEQYKETKSIAPGNTATLQIANPAGLPIACRGAIWIDGRYYVDGRNPVFGTVALMVGHGGTLRDGELWKNGTVAFSDTIEERRAAPAMVVDGVSTTVTRLNDEEHFKVFAVALSVA